MLWSPIIFTWLDFLWRPIFLIPQMFFHKIKTSLGLMTPRLVVSQTFSSGKSLFRPNEFAGFGNFSNHSQGSFLSYSRRFSVIPKAQFTINTSFQTYSPSPRILEAKTIDFGLVAPRFQRLSSLAPCLDGFTIEFYSTRQGCSIKVDETFKPLVVQIRSTVLAISHLESLRLHRPLCPRLYSHMVPHLTTGHARNRLTLRKPAPLVWVRLPAQPPFLFLARVRIPAGSVPAQGHFYH